MAMDLAHVHVINYHASVITLVRFMHYQVGVKTFLDVYGKSDRKGLFDLLLGLNLVVVDDYYDDKQTQPKNIRWSQFCK